MIPDDFSWISHFLAPLAVATVVGLASAYATAHATMARFEERLAQLEQKQATQAELSAAEDRAKAYTDSKFSELMVIVTEIRGNTAAVRDDVRDIKYDLRDRRNHDVD